MLPSRRCRVEYYTVSRLTLKCNFIYFPTHHGLPCSVFIQKFQVSYCYFQIYTEFKPKRIINVHSIHRNFICGRKVQYGLHCADIYATHNLSIKHCGYILNRPFYGWKEKKNWTSFIYIVKQSNMAVTAPSFKTRKRKMLNDLTSRISIQIIILTGQ
jgi:hypothetical protein